MCTHTITVTICPKGSTSLSSSKFHAGTELQVRILDDNIDSTDESYHSDTSSVFDSSEFEEPGQQYDSDITDGYIDSDNGAFPKLILFVIQKHLFVICVCDTQICGPKTYFVFVNHKHIMNL